MQNTTYKQWSVQIRKLQEKAGASQFEDNLPDKNRDYYLYKFVTKANFILFRKPGNIQSTFFQPHQSLANVCVWTS